MTNATETAGVQQSGPSPKVRRLSARLAAVQALYQVMHNHQPIRNVVREYIDYRSDMEIDGERLVKPDAMLLKKILHGVDERMAELDAIVRANVKGGTVIGDEGESGAESQRDIEPLLKAILLCGAYELLVHHEIDGPIIINDYLNITHAFYEKGEVSLVNGVLDKLAKLLREL